MGDEDDAGDARGHGGRITNAPNSWPSRWRWNSRAAGLPVVIVNPTAPVGDHDVKPTPTGKIVLDFLNGDMPAFIDTGLNVVDARDVAAGHLLACERGATGRALYPGIGEPDAGADSAKTGGNHGPQGAHRAAALCRGVLRAGRAARRGRS